MDRLRPSPLPSGEDAAVYPVIADPPFDAGAVKLTVACASPAVAETAVGTPGTVGAAVGVTAGDAAEAGLVPTALVAVTVNVYDVPSVKPVTVNGLLAPVAVFPPGRMWQYIP